MIPLDIVAVVRKRSQGGEEELQKLQHEVGQLAENTALALKKNVYKNYSQFIETAKEISILQGEMYQLSHMLTDQKSIMNAMIEMSITGHNVEGPEETDEGVGPGEDDTQKHLAFLLEKVEGCSSVTEVPGRHLVHDGDLLEIESESFTTVQKLHAFLLNDSLMLTTWLPHRRGPVKYRLQCLYELDSLAVVNARDMGGVKNAFKILMFPDTRMFQAETPKAKRQWLDILEETKKKKAALDTQRKEAAAAAVADRKSAVSNADVEPPTERSRNSILESELLHADWLQEAPEDLDVAIAQRDFEGAVDLVERVNEHLDGCPKGQAVREYRARIELRIKQLTEVLKQELQVSPERSIRGGPRCARRAVTQLIRLGKSSQACDLFLKNRTAIIRYNIRQLKIEGNTSLYVKRLCLVFFDNLLETGKEFMKAFPQHFGCFSAFVVWTKSEMLYFVTTFASQVFANKTNFTIVAECVAEARTHCNKLSEIGLEMTFTFDRLMASDVERLIQEAGDFQMEAVKHRCSEDQWRPVNHLNHMLQVKFEDEMKDIGLTTIGDFTYDVCFTWLTQNSVQFTKSYVSLCVDMLKMYNPNQHHLVTAAFSEIISAQLRHADRSISSHKFPDQKTVILKNAEFLVQCLAPLVQSKYQAVTGQPCSALDHLQATLKKIRRAASTASQC
ncbi:hypothetical protein CAPTEDRAFT_141927 [Capitella teleta]|uniref:Exocyst complex component 8 n=1 Tax=Capitella teleta TaxID=283909 RepID=R7UM80_CAPTE|nr:hypothetical protein CAPTEDRAFT_141927 [Capitella teleta]|eukprot:ELU07335.1 hypothetical protein CAPTEDRAFT_141927 [Capitella teleta]